MALSKKESTDYQGLNIPQASVFTWEKTMMELLPEKAVFLPSKKALLIADPHFGKAAHFRKAGVPVPEAVHNSDFFRIQLLIEKYDPKDLFFLGDLFHSDFNYSWDQLEAFIQGFAETRFHLVKGNHDILPQAIYRSSKWIIHEEQLELDGLLLTHEPLEAIPQGQFNICGHIHPGIMLQGKGRQKLRLPCFFVQGRQMVLPAFGRFTGLALMKMNQGASAYVVTQDKVLPVKLMD